MLGFERDCLVCQIDVKILKVKVYDFYLFRVVLCDEKIFVEEDGVYHLSEESGWFSGNTIYLWDGARGIEKFGIFVHEFVEMVLSKVMPQKLAHIVANIIESLLTLGRSKVYWR